MRNLLYCSTKNYDDGDGGRVSSLVDIVCLFAEKGRVKDCARCTYWAIQASLTCRIIVIRRGEKEQRFDREKAFSGKWVRGVLHIYYWYHSATFLYLSL